MKEGGSKEKRGIDSYTGHELERVPPQDINAERACLGAVLQPSAGTEPLEDVIAILGDDIDLAGFYRMAHRLIYGAVLRVHDSGKPVDMLVVTAELMKSDDLEKVGGVPYIDEMIQSCPSSANAGYYAEIMKDSALRRKGIYLGAQISFKAYDDSENIEEVLEDAADALQDITQWKSGLEGSLKTVETAFAEYSDFMDHIEDWSIKFNVPTLDKHLRFSIGDVGLLIAHSGVGKSLWAQNMTEAAWTRQRAKSIYFSLEMMAFSLMERQAASLWELHPRDIQKIMLNEGDDLLSDTVDEKDSREAIRKAIEEAYGGGIFYVDRPGLSLRQMERIIKTTSDVRLVVFDYIQLMKARGETRYERMCDISQGLKEFAKRTQTAVLVISQVNKGVANEKTRITMNDVRDSGTIPEVADLVFGFWQDEKDSKVRHLEILKSRHMPGAAGRKCKMFFPNASPRLVEMEENTNVTGSSFGID